MRECGNSRKLVALDEVMLNTLFYTHSCASLVFHNSEGEGERSSLGRDLGEGRSGSLHLEHVGGRSLGEDGGLLNVGGFGLNDWKHSLSVKSFEERTRIMSVIRTVLSPLVTLMLRP